MTKCCITRQDVVTACSELNAAHIAVNARDLSTPPFEKVETALALMASLDLRIKQMFVTVLRNPEHLKKAPPSIVRFVHETMDFVENGNKRSINIEEWSKVIRSVLDTQYGTEKAQLGPQGRSWSVVGTPVGKTTFFKPHETIHGIKEMSPCILLHKWLQREQGLNDAMISYQLLGRISANFCN